MIGTDVNHDPLTREEWERRQQAAPPGLARLFQQARQAAAVRSAAEAARRERERAEEVLRRAAFEEALAFVLAAEGGEWLADYRRPETDPVRRFAQDGVQVAAFDLSGIGMHAIRVVLYLNAGSGRWHPDPSPFVVQRPDEPRHYRTLAEAAVAAATYCPVPF